MEIELVRDKAQADAVYAMAYEFIDWLRDRYPEMSGDIDAYLVNQKFDEQISQVLTFYAPPKGECLLATKDGDPIGILMLKDIDGGTCEMNRMFVRESGRGLGAGRALVKRLIERAQEMGFRSMVLGALPRHHEAIALYRSCGFLDDEGPRREGQSSKAVPMILDLGSV